MQAWFINLAEFYNVEHVFVLKYSIDLILDALKFNRDTIFMFTFGPLHSTSKGKKIGLKNQLGMKLHDLADLNIFNITLSLYCILKWFKRLWNLSHRAIIYQNIARVNSIEKEVKRWLQIAILSEATLEYSAAPAVDCLKHSATTVQ